jgi:hypothetical protein
MKVMTWDRRKVAQIELVVFEENANKFSAWLV